MGRSIYLFGATTDVTELCHFAESIGLVIVPPLKGSAPIDAHEDPSAGPFCFLSACSETEMHPYGSPLRYGTATDPLIEFLRPYVMDGELVMGRLYWSDDVPELAAVTKPFFRQLLTWIKSNWSKLPEGQFIGPKAKEMMTNGVSLQYLPRNLTIEKR